MIAAVDQKIHIELPSWHKCVLKHQKVNIAEINHRIT